MVRVLHISESDYLGGAGIAARRILLSVEEAGVTCDEMIARKKNKGETRGTTYGRHSVEIAKIRSAIGQMLIRICSRESGRYQSLGVLPSLLVRRINSCECDIVHLHWINGEMLSVRDIGKIKKPIVWTAHDCWPAQGINHLPDQEGLVARHGKRGCSRIVDSIIRRQKQRAWQDITWVGPSRWMEEFLSGSCVTANSEIERIGHPLDHRIYKKMDRSECRRGLGLPVEGCIVMCVAAYGERDKNKGWDVAADCVNRVNRCEKEENVWMLTVGSYRGEGRFSVHNGRIDYMRVDNEEEMVMLYGACNAVLVASKFESFGLVAAEAQMCGRIVIGFKTSGLLDIVEDGVTGFLVDMDVIRLSDAVTTILKNGREIEGMEEDARKLATKKWNYRQIGIQYKQVYERVLSLKRV